MTDTLNMILNAFLLLLRCGVAFRAIYLFVRMALEPDDAGSYKSRLKTLIIFYILAESAWQLQEVVRTYYL